MLIGALAVFTLVAVMGLSMICDAWRGIRVEPAYAKTHALVSLVGSAMVIYLAVEGDARLYANIGLAVVIIGLGGVMAVASKKGKRVPKGILVAHAGLAVACYLLLGFFAVNPGVALF